MFVMCETVRTVKSTVLSVIFIIRLLGIIRPEDISNQNTVQSSRIANAKISYTGAGDVADTSKKGWFAKLVDVVTPL